MKNVACTKEYHDGLAKNPFAWRIKTHHVGYEVDVHETLELGCCRWCGRTIARAVWFQE